MRLGDGEQGMTQRVRHRRFDLIPDRGQAHIFQRGFLRPAAQLNSPVKMEALEGDHDRARAVLHHVQDFSQRLAGREVSPPDGAGAQVIFLEQPFHGGDEAALFGCGCPADAEEYVCGHAVYFFPMSLFFNSGLASEREVMVLSVDAFSELINSSVRSTKYW